MADQYVEAPRTPEGWCSCAYCTAIRQGTLPAVPGSPGLWAKRMGARANVYVEMGSGTDG